jgi:hypothetical protein
LTLFNAPSKIPTLEKEKKPSNLEKPISQINNCSRVHVFAPIETDRERYRDWRKYTCRRNNCIR